MTYRPPATLWEVSEKLKFDEPLDAGDPRFVPTEKARGNISFASLYRKLGVDDRSLALKAELDRLYILFCGHRGCGKSTELRRIAKQLDHPDKFHVLFLDTAKQLDPNNLQYADILFALANHLFQRLADDRVEIASVFLTRLEGWFKESIETHESMREFAAEIRTGAQVESGIPFLGKLFAEITNAFKTNSSYKKELRTVLKNSFSTFADSFNQLIVAAEEKLQKLGKARKLLFVVDGTDRLSGEDSRRLFIEDIHQLQLITGLFIYCAPIHLIYAGSELNQTFDLVFRLPMIKIAEKGSPVHLEDGYDAMRAMLLSRADRCLFDSATTLDYFIENSGGHPRDLLRLLSYAFLFASGDLFDEHAAQRAVKALATDYRRILDDEDFELLKAIDASPPEHTPRSERAQRLLYNLALLEYNDYWWQSHPVVRTLPGYSVPPASA